MKQFNLNFYKKWIEIVLDFMEKKWLNLNMFPFIIIVL